MRALQSRNEAILNNCKTYAGSPCRNCANTLRYVNGNSCIHCMAVRVRSAAKKEYDKNYHVAHANKKLQAALEWSKLNPDKRSAISFTYDSKRRAIKKEGVGAKELFAWVNKQEKVCYWCDVVCETSYHIDHYHPLAKGGKHELDNLVIACSACNITKNAKDPYEFAKSKGRLF